MQLKTPRQGKKACERPRHAQWARPAGHQSLPAEMLLQDFEELRQPCGMRGPGRAGDEVAIGGGAGDVERDEDAAGELDLRLAGRIRIELLTLDDSGGGENLRAVAESGDGLIGLGEVADDLKDLGVQAQ